MPGITQPLEDHVRVHCATTRNLRHRNARRHRVSADRPLLFAPPKPLRPTCHSLLRSVRYPKRTLSITPYQRQSSQAGRLLNSGAWFFLFVILDRLSLQAIHLNKWSEIPRPPLRARGWRSRLETCGKRAANSGSSQHAKTPGFAERQFRSGAWQDMRRMWRCALVPPPRHIAKTHRQKGSGMGCPKRPSAKPPDVFAQFAPDAGVTSIPRGLQQGCA